ncbi:hypothetical protein AUJ66_01155 [Candidatus Desantisbacteria bacterium CG1_02_38_46]|uniref:Beta-galactosidase trimerisation domain-containing protein n=3 Tax=unclassified Candidatus Desantisiibacteriota TaxID=3106372 RepID=A0A2H9PBD0_9BACT|nr:MAG: hypothetical protein AUJ66_01155 [Candidatus Desantisbacteria bacterium CG1_02_38_46]PIU51536.1 MAG: hypothetical protein COS91_03935 [Candidatus Desantisbacteria bacterium CG07_land_8_20_14_0_80_39_15]PIZ16070.1 MAG: hypothetical protein COY51_03555 [Candidatus Desantisbacteria bacterium CG_4_10_14_0_8_um_filter_39_17]
MSEKKWWEKPVRMLRHDFISGYDELTRRDLEKLAREKKEKWHINCEWMVGSLGASPGRGFQTTFEAKGFERVPGFEKFDLLRKYLPYAHKYGIHLLSYLNLHWFSYEFAKKHPGWEQITSSGKPYGELFPLYGNGTTFCVNSPWREWAFSLIEEAMKTGIDGIFMDGPVIFPDCCYCSSCQERFYSIYHKKIPLEDWQSPLWRKSLSFREESMALFLKDAQERVKKINPEGVIFLNAGGWHPGSWRVARDIQKLSPYQNFNGAEAFFHLHSGEHYLFDSSIMAKYLRAEDKPVVVFTHHAQGVWHYIPLAAREIEIALLQTIANKANPWIAIFESKYSPDRESFERAQNVFAFQEKNEKYYTDTESIAEIALLFSFQTSSLYISSLPSLYKDLGTGIERDLIFDKGSGKKIIDWKKRKEVCEGLLSLSHMGYYSILTRNHFLFDIILDNSLTEEKLKKYKVLILPDACLLSDEKLKIIKSFVSRGGSLISSFEAGFYDEEGKEKKNRMFEILGIKKIDGLFPTVKGENYFKADKDIFGFQKNQLIERSPYAVQITPEEKVSSFFTFLNPLPRIYLPLRGNSKYPAILINKFGRGKVIYFPFDIGSFYGEYKPESHEKILKESINYLLKPTLITNAPPTVEIEVYKKSRSTIFHFVNLSGDMQRPLTNIIPVKNIEVEFSSGNPSKKVFALKDNKRIPFSFSKGKLKFKISLDNYEVVVCE